ncbi:MAG: S41 family peptidase [Rickettsiaceae bacterium]|nr:S41 family peptidase [Rickettsiaceae bacterium]
MNIFRYLGIVIIILPLTAFSVYNKESNAKHYSKFKEVFEKIEKDYVKEPNKQELIDAAIEGMLSSLDPHSSYFSDEDLENFVASTKGEFGGLGLEIAYENGAIKVISPIDDLVAFRAGIKSGDLIVKINNEFVSNLGFNKGVLALRGEPGTKVKITIVRNNEAKPLEFELVRELVKIKAVKANLDNNIAYIRISSFTEKALQELKKNLTDLIATNKGKVKGIILDLRNNPGGLLDQAVAISDYFIDSGVIVSTKGRNISSEVVYKASQNSDKAPKLPLVVLVNDGSASASEIVAAALKENNRGIVLGTKTYGKGSIQTLSPIDSRSACKLTTSLYYTPKGSSIQAEGVLPDVVIDQAKAEYPKNKDDSLKFSEASFKNHIKNERSEKEKSDKPPAQDGPSGKDEKSNLLSNQSEKYYTDFQYARAYDLLQGIIILERKQ